MTNDLFSSAGEEHRLRIAPLAARLRPQTLDEVVGQRHLLGAGAAFRSMVERGSPVSMILWGPPGTGKTTLARLVASETDAFFEALSATAAGVKDVRRVLTTARERLATDQRRTVLFLDEIHRFSKSQQDALLPGAEDGTVILVGATTENPFFEVNSPLVSRSTLFRLNTLDPVDLVHLIDRALDDPRGLGEDGLSVAPDAREALSERTGGDARLVLNALESAAGLCAARHDATITLTDVEEALQRRIIRYDKAGSRHYDVVSAFIKSVRGSDVDASLYWLHTMLEAGEDPEFVARRMIILASEDVGLADPQALVVAVAAFSALQVVGLPEAAYALTEAVIYLASAPKSNSTAEAMRAARGGVDSSPGSEVPFHLRSADDDHNYLYPHDAPGGVVRQQYLPDGSESLLFYRPGSRGSEQDLADRLREADEVLGKPDRGR